MTCNDCIHKCVCYRGGIDPAYAGKCGDFYLYIKPPLKWERLKGVMTPGGDPCVRCPVCKSRDSEHLIGIESHRHWSYCPVCGERLEE